MRDSLETALRTGEPYRLPTQRYNIRVPDGSWAVRYWSAVNIPVHGARGEVRCLLNYSEDVTSEVLGREALERAERRAASILGRVEDAHMVLDHEFRIVSMNPAAELMIGKSRNELLGRTHWEVFPASVEADAGRAYRRVVAE